MNYIIGEESGIPRVVSALAAHSWPNLTLKGEFCEVFVDVFDEIF